MACRHRTTNLFYTQKSNAPETSVRAYTDGSKYSNPETTTCAIFVPTLNHEGAWTLTKGCPPEAIIYRFQFSHHYKISKLLVGE
jgi:hypothetical protein